MHAKRKSTPKVDPRYAWFPLEVRKSRIHRFGVFAREAIPASKPVIEYTGRRITMRKAIDRKPPNDRYLVRLDRDWVADGGVGGSGAEFINHSCDANLVCRRSKGRVVLWSRRKIRAGEELTMFYAYPLKLVRVPCGCGSPKCRGIFRYKIE
ncbi:MAG TPA: SET domain-containing protein-lysine N-methyltransferase [Verrucomicrobiae bacterium]|nr:SET domain-containing protein-lysine N-methyltransferase [Verrucomicrobiae bacterium]